MSRKPNVKDLTLKQRIGQMMCVGDHALFSGESFAEAEELIKEYQYAPDGEVAISKWML